MSSLEDRIRRAFIDETVEILSALEAALLRLEEDPADSEAISSVFRSFHTIKGSGAMAGFDEMSGFTHEIENVYDLVRSGKITAGKSLIDVTLSACDLVREMIEAPPSNEPLFQAKTNEILSTFKRLFPETAGTKKISITLPPSGLNPFLSAVTGKSTTYRIRFRPAKDIFSSGMNPVLLLNELRNMGDCSVVAHMDEIPELADLDPEACYMYWDVILTTVRDIDAIRDVFIFVEDGAELNIEIIDTEENGEAEDYKKLGEILVEKHEISREELEDILKEKKGAPLGELLVDRGLVRPAGVEAALAEQEHIREMREGRQRAENASIRVSSLKLDTLVNLVGELVTVQARLSQASLRRPDPELLSIAEEVERLTGEIRDSTMNIRMLPIATTFSKFRRLVRDLAGKLDKEVELTTDGGDTELDKTVIEKLNDPLVHLIRNCLDHGIELPELREAIGKKRKGSIHLSAAHSGPNVVIKIIDDGAGLDRDAIRARAIDKGLIAADSDLSEREIFSLVLLPGFSTSENVTSVSGRGVGMDVLKKAVESLRGAIEIDSKQGIGTAITLSLPLTLAIIEGLLVKIGEEMFVLPLSSVEECVELARKDPARSGNRHIANVRGAVVPYIRLREEFVIAGEAPDIEQIVIVKERGRRVGFVVDTVIGEYQTVIKNLGRVFKDIEGISGATILGDGSVALILDVPRLLEIVEKKEVEET